MTSETKRRPEPMKPGAVGIDYGDVRLVRDKFRQMRDAVDHLMRTYYVDEETARKWLRDAYKETD